MGHLALFHISISNIDSRYISKFEKNIDNAILKNIDINNIDIDIDKEILENIDIDKGILENINIDKIAKRLEFLWRL